MTTIRAGNAMDPPQTTTNVVGFKRIRKIVNTNGGTGQLTLGDVRSCLPLTTPDVRFVKLSVWSTDEATLSCVFPVGSSTNVHPGDDSAWTDDGVPGNSRAQIHLTPAFDYRNFWFIDGVAANTVIATFGVPTTGVNSVIVDITVNFRTAVQSCPALEHLKYLREHPETLEEEQHHESV